jgi:hypothetical protein
MAVTRDTYNQQTLGANLNDKLNQVCMSAFDRYYFRLDSRHEGGHTRGVERDRPSFSLARASLSILPLVTSEPSCLVAQPS